MEKHTNETRLLTPTVWKNSLASFGKLILLVVFVAVFLMCTIFAIYPSGSVQISKFLGFEALEESSLLRVYEKESTASSLYNIIVFEQSAGNYEKELYYINLLEIRNDYSDFCEKLDNSSNSAIETNKSSVAYLCNTQSYLINQKIKCMWNTNVSSSTICTYICANLTDTYLFEYGLTTYIEYIYNSKLESDEKLTLVKTLLETTKLEGSDIVTISELLEQRITDLESLSTSDDVQNILAKHTLMNLWKGKYLANLLGAYDGEGDEIFNEYSAARQNYYQVLV